MTHVNVISVKPVSPSDRQAKALIEALDAYQLALYPPESNHLEAVEELERSGVHFLGAYAQDRLCGCGAAKLHTGGYGELKRIYVSPSARGLGIGKALMAALEQKLADDGVALVRLETGIYQPEALALYENLGYRRIGPFGSYTDDPLSVFMEKSL